MVDEYLDFLQKLPVDLLVLCDKGEHAVDFVVEVLVLVQSGEVVLPQFFLLRNDQVQLVLLVADCRLNCCDAALEFLSLVDLHFQESSATVEVVLGLAGLLL